jgi:hypothetical protein
MGFFFGGYSISFGAAPCLAATTATMATIAVATAVKLYGFMTAWPIQARCRLLHRSLWHAKGRNLHFVLWISIACQPTHKLALHTLVVRALWSRIKAKDDIQNRFFIASYDLWSC